MSVDVNKLGDRIISKLDEMSKQNKQYGYDASESIGTGWDEGIEESVSKIRASSIKLNSAFKDLRGKINKQIQQFQSELNGKKFSIKIDFSDIDINSQAFKQRLNELTNSFKGKNIIEFDEKGSEKQFENLMGLYTKYESKLNALRGVKSFSSNDDVINNLKQQIALASKLQEIFTFLDEQASDFLPNSIRKSQSELSKIIKETPSIVEQLQGVNGKNQIKDVSQLLNSLKKTIDGIKESLDPISKMFQNENEAIEKMSQKGIAQFTSLSEAVGLLYSNLLNVERTIDTISKKDFNVTNITSNNVDNKAIERKQITQYRSAVNTLYRQITEDITKDLNSIVNSGGKFDKLLASNTGFDIQRVAQSYVSKLKSTKLEDLQLAFEDLYTIRDRLINNIKQLAESIGAKVDVSSYSTEFGVLNGVPEINPEKMQQQAESAKNASEQEKNLAEETKNATNASKEALEYFQKIADALNNIKLAIEPLTKAFSTEGTLFNQMATSGALSIDSLIEKLKEASELARTVVASSNTDTINTSVQSEKAEANEFNEIEQAAKSAADGKKEFTAANKQVDSSAKESVSSILAEAEAMEEAGEKAKNVWTTKRAGGSIEGLNLPVQIIGENGKNAVQMFSELKGQLESQFRSPVQIKFTSSPNENGELEATRATVSYINKELGVTVNQMYDIARNEDGLLIATQSLETATIGAAKEAKNFDASMEKALALAKIETFKKQCGSIEIDLTNVKKAAENITDKFSLELFNKELKLVGERLKQVRAGLKGENTLDTIAAAEKKLLTLPTQIDTLRKKLEPLMKLDGAENIKTKIDEIMQSYRTFLSTNDSNVKINAFESIINNLSVVKALMDNLKTDSSIADFDKISRQQIESYRKIVEYRQKINSGKLGAEETKTTQALLKNEQEKFIKITQQLKSYENLYNAEDRLKVLSEARLSVLEKINDAEARAADREAQRADKQAQNYGKSTTNSATKKYDQIVSSYDFLNDGNMSDGLIQSMKEYEAQYNKLIELRQRFANDPTLAANQQARNEFNQTAKSVEESRKKVQLYISDIEKLRQVQDNGTQIGKEISFDPSGVTSASDAIRNYAKTISDGKLQITGWNSVGNEMYGVINKGKGVIENVTVALERGTNTLYAYRTGTKEVGTAWQNLTSGISRKAQELLRYAVGGGVIFQAINQVRQGIQYVKDIDSALVELKKVTNETDQAYADFLKTASKTGAIIGSTISDFTNATADFARLGYSIQEASKLAEAASIYKNVGDGIDSVEQATESIISTMKAFGIEADNSMSIVDKFNEIGNNFAISSTGIGEALTRSASALNEAGNSIDESIGLITAANSVVQNPDQVGTALKTLALRLRGTKTELKEAGEDVDGMADSVSSLQKKLLALSHGKVDIMLDENTFKNTKQILEEMSKAWGYMTDIERASALELMGGKRQANILSSIIKNYDTVNDVIETSLDSQNSAYEENKKVLNSVQGKTIQFTNAIQNLWQKTLGSNLIKDILTLGTGIVNLVSKIGLIPSALAGVAFYLTVIKKNNPVTLIKDIINTVQNFGTASNALGGLKNAGVAFDSSSINAYAASVADLTVKQQALALSSAGLTKQQVAEVLAKNGCSEATIQQAMAEASLSTAKGVTSKITKEELFNLVAENDVKLSEQTLTWLCADAEEELTRQKILSAVASGDLAKKDAAVLLSLGKLDSGVKGLGSSLKALFLNNPIGWVVLAITAITSIVSAVKKARDEIEQSARETLDTFKEAEKTLKSQKNTIDEVYSEYKTLSKGVNEFGDNVSLTTDEYNKYNEITNKIADMFPELVQGYTEQGNAILTCKGNVNELTRAYEEAAQAARQAAIAGADDVFDVAKKNYFNDTITTFDGKTGIKNQKILAEELIKVINNGVDEEITSFMSDLNVGNIEIDGIKFSGTERSDLFKSVGIKDPIIRESPEKEVAKLKESLPKLLSYVKSSTTQINAETSKVKSILRAYLGEDEDYKKLDSKTKSAVDDIVSQLNSEFVFEFDNVDSLYNWVSENIVGAFKDDTGEIQNAINDFLKVDTSKISVGDYNGIVEKFETALNNAGVDETFKSKILEAFNISDKTNEINASINKAVTNLGEGFKDELEGLSFEDLEIAATLNTDDIKSQRQEIIQEAKDLGVDINKTVYGNIDTNNRQVMTWTDATIKQYKDAIESWGEKAEDFKGDISTVFGSSAEFDGIEIAFSPMLQTESGKPVLLDKATVYEYIYGLIDNVKKDAQGKWHAEDLFELDTKGLKINGTVIKNLLADIGDTAILTGSAMHYVGDNGAIALANAEITAEDLALAIQKAKAATASFDLNDYLDSIDGISKNISSYQSALSSLESGQFTLSDFVELVKQFPDLADGVDIASGSFDGLETNLRRAIKASPKDMIEELKDLRDQLQLVGKDTSGVEQLINAMENMPIDAVKNLSDEYLTLSDNINGVKKAQTELNDAMSKDTNDGYTDYAEAYSKMEELMQKGAIGSSSNLWDIASVVFGKDSSVVLQQDADALWDLIQARKAWYDGAKDDEYSFSGIENFIKYVEGKNEVLKEFGATWSYNDGVFNMDLNNKDWDDFANALGITSEEFTALMFQVGQFFDIEWENLGDINNYLDKFAEKGKNGTESMQELHDSIESLLGESIDWDNVTDEELKVKLKAQGADNSDIDDFMAKYEDAKERLKDPLDIKLQIDGKQGEEALKVISEIEEIKGSITKSDKFTFIDESAFTETLKNAEYAEDKIAELKQQLVDCGAVMLNTSGSDPLGLQSLSSDTEKTIGLLESLEGVIQTLKDGTVAVNVENLYTAMSTAGYTPESIKSYIDSIQSNTKLTIDGEVTVGSAVAKKTIDDLNAEKEKLSESETTTYKVDGTGMSTLNTIKSMWDDIVGNKSTTYSVYRTEYTSTVRNGRSRVNGTANANGNWGAQKSEKSLVGELGPEIRVRGNHWQTIGDNGAEFVDIKKGDIIFNHKQSEELLKNGHISSRGRFVGSNAFAQGTAFATLNGGYKSYGSSSSSSSSSSSYSSSTDSLSDAAETIKDAADEFKEVFDWFEVLLNEVDSDLDLMAAKLENAVSLSEKDKIYKQILSANHYKMDELYNGIKLYEDKAASYLKEIPKQYREMAKNGAVKITDFVGEGNEEVVEAIQNYREWAEKVQDLNKQLEETKKIIADTRVEQQQQAKTNYDNEISLISAKNDRIQESVDLLKEEGKQVSPLMYEEMAKNSKKELSKLQSAKTKMQAELDSAVKSGDVKKYSSQWYEMVNAINAVDGEINSCKTDIEGFQNSINDLHWENFDKLMQQINNVSEEANNVRSLISEEDSFNDVGEWTGEGITSLGMLITEMENAQYQSQLYGKEIVQLEKDFKKGKYSQDEYNEKLKELQDKQWGSIKAYESSKKELVSLNKARVQAVKDGMQKEIDAYEKLINKQKESLSAQKDAHDWNKQVADQQKEIAKIQRQIDAMAGDNSAAAVAKRAQLYEELYELQDELAESFYDHDIEMQQKALDDSLEAYKTDKEDKMEALDEYLKEEDQVISDSFDLVKLNADVVGQTLKDISKEYGVDFSDTLVNPWKDGASAIGEYNDSLDASQSTYSDYLKNLKKLSDNIQSQSNKEASDILDDINKNANDMTNASYEPPKPKQDDKKKDEKKSTNSKPAKGETVTVDTSATRWARDGGNGTRMDSWVPGSSFTVYQVDGQQALIGRNGQYTGWINIKDLKGYAKGTIGVKNSQLAKIDEQLEELVLHADGNGRLAYLTKGTSVIPGDLTKNLMQWGALNPQSFLDQNRPKIGAPHITSNNVELNLEFGALVHVDNCNNDTIPELQKMVKNEFDTMMKQVNKGLKRYTR